MRLEMSLAWERLKGSQAASSTSASSPSTDVPTDAYDVALLDQHGADVLMGVGTNVSSSRANTAANFRTPLNVDRSYVYLHNATLTPAISNAGAAKKGIIKLIVR